MDSDASFAEPEPDLAQLLVLEAGRIIEDLSVELAMTLPSRTRDRRSAIETQSRRLSNAQLLLAAARVIGSMQ